ncbi:VWA domain-containing protein [Lysobacter pythonis]|uniref:VWA domain-containing protein n=1 Tax=Solilutibacter pythonis TaxID=2483112 RepID=A0A3M2I4W4_9GAMM|nr:tetratricopeptide repeat protein [Lysobacter pythonis]RMH93284.1 VWA domain-containing protein [Lysobacter pythonis]
MNFDLPALPLHFLRPHWLWLLALPPLAWWWWRRRRGRVEVWERHIDPHLRAHVLEGGARETGAASPWPWLAALVLGALAMAGPAWRQLPQPVWQNARALVVAVDLSSRTLATDLPPSRLLRLRAKLQQLLRERRDGQIALVAFAEDAFVVTPLTDDAANVALFVDALAPEIMPVDGQRPARAIELAQRLMRQAGADGGDILLITDRADDAAIKVAGTAAARGFRVSVLGLGNARGAEVRDGVGRVARARLEAASLHALAAAGGGRMTTLSAEDTDLRVLDVLDTDAAAGTGERVGASGQRGRHWRDKGYWLLPPLMLLALWAFRRRALNLVLAMLLLGAWPAPPAWAQAAAPASEKGGWWWRADQVRYRLSREGDRAYRAGDYARAADSYARVPGAAARYNLGNALAKAGRYREAIAAYDQALALDPALPDARENRAVVARALARKSPPGRKSKDESRDDDRRRGEPDGQGRPRQDGQQGEPRYSPKDAARADERERQRGGQGQPPASLPSAPGRNPPPAPAEDAAARRAAEQAQREAMRRALAEAAAGETPARTPPAPPESQAERERRQAVDAWLRRVPDTPGDWLRQKFWIEYQRRRAGKDD